MRARARERKNLKMARENKKKILEREKRKEGKEKREKRNVSTHSPCQETTTEVRKNLGFRPVPLFVQKKTKRGKKEEKERRAARRRLFFCLGENWTTRIVKE